MVKLSGQGAFKNVDLVVEIFDNAHTKDKGHYFPVVSLHPDHPAAQAEDQESLALNKHTDKSGRTNYSSSYSASQMNTFAEAAQQNNNTAPRLDKDGNRIGYLMVVNADVQPSKRGDGLAINTNTVKPSELSAQPVNGVTLDSRVVAKNQEYAQRRAAEREANQQQQGSPLPGVDQPGMPVFGNEEAQAPQAQTTGPEF